MIKFCVSARRPAILAGAAAAMFCAAAAPAWAQNTGNGPVGEYYNSNNFTGAINTTKFNEPAINYNFTNLAPAGTTVNADNFSIRWRGQIEAPSTETYTFFTTVDDQARLTINGVQIIGLGGSNQGTFAMTLNQKYDFMLEYVEFGGNASIRLEWSSPVTTPRADVPQTRFYSPVATPATPTINTNGGICPVNNVILSTATGGAAIYYTLNGNDPGLTNPAATGAILYAAPFTVNAYTKVRARAYVGGLSSDIFTSNQFSPQLPALTLPAGTVQNNYFKEYDTTGATDLAFNTKIPRRRGVVNHPQTNTPPMYPRPNADQNFGYHFQAYLTIPAGAQNAGMWTFWTASDDGSRLYIDGNLVVENNFAQGVTSRNGFVALDPGVHLVTVLFAQGGGGFGLNPPQWMGPVGSDVPAQADIPDTAYATEDIVATPVFSVPGGNFTGSQAVTLTCATPNAVLYYTTDGSNPDPLSSNGSGASGLVVTLTSTSTLKVCAGAAGLNTSDTASATYTRQDGGLLATSGTASGVTTEVIVNFNRPLNESTVTPGNFTINNGVTLSAAVPTARPGILAGRWTMDDATGADTSGSANNATVVAGVFPGFAPQNANFSNPAAVNANTLGFDGATTTFTVPDSPTVNVNIGSFTAALWVRTSNAAVQQHLIGKWDNATSIGWFLDMNNNASLHFRMRDNAGRNFDVTTGGGLIPANTWTHVAIRADKLIQRVTWFVNGQIRQGPQDNDANMENLTNTVGLGIGSNPSIGGSFFTGSIDDVRLYRAALSDAEIAALAAGMDHVSSSVRLTTSALAPATLYTLTVATGVQSTAGLSPLAGTTLPFRFFPAGTVSFEHWGGINGINVGGGAVSDLIRNGIFQNDPTGGSQPALAELNANFDNYGARLRGYFIPPSTGNFQFAIATDDGGKLLLSTDDDPANKRVIAYENVWTGIRQFNSAGGAVPVQSGSIALTAGKKYYFEGYMKEGGGGDNIAIAVKAFDGTPIADATAPAGLAGSLFLAANIAPYIDPPYILTQPFPRAVEVGGTITLTVNAQATHTGTPHFQWQRNGVNIGGATGATLTIANAATANAGTYTVVITNSVTSITSAVATVVVLDHAGMTISPPAGPITGGNTVTITGHGFVPGITTVTFGGTAATNIVVANTTTLTCTAPAHAVGTVLVRVGTQTGNESSLGYTYLDVPTITSIAPAEGPTGSQSIVINGTNFSPIAVQNIVTVNGTTAGVSITNATTTALTVTIPASPTPGAVTPVAVTVTHAGGGPAGGTFTYYPPPVIASLSPPAGTAAGQLVVINGSFYSTVLNATTVSWNGASVPVTNVTTTTVTVSAPPSPTPGAITAVNVIVSTPGGASNTATYTYYPPTSVTGISITEGSTAGGYSAVISGTNFSNVNAQNVVTFGAAGAATVTNSTNTAITVTVPALVPPGAAPTTVTVSITCPGGSGATSFTYYPPPTITSVTPSSGQNAGGDSIGIAGSNFSTTGITTVTINGVAATVTNVTSTNIIATTPARVPPATAPSADVLTVSTTGGTVDSTFTYFPTPAFTLMNPTVGTSQGGDSVTITGDFFLNGNTSVTFGGVAGAITAVTPTSITVTTPGHDAGTVSVLVTAPGGSVSAGTFTYQGPRIIIVNPPSGPIAGGQVVTITGSGFVNGATTLNINGAIVPTSVTATTITFTTPAHGAGTFDVVVTASGLSATLAGGYTWISAATQTSVLLNRGPMSGGQSVVIAGTNFAVGNTTVRFGGVAGIVTNVTLTTVTVTTPAHAPSGAEVPVPVQVAVFGVNATGAVTYTYVPPPTLSALIPNRGPIAGGQTLTLTGTFFEPGGQTHVTFAGGAPITATVVSATSITVVTPPHAAGLVAVNVNTFTPPQATVGNSVAYTYVDPATTVDLDLTMVVDNSSPGINTNVTFTLQVHNSGSIGATGVIVYDLLPGGLDFVSAVPSVGTYVSTSGLWTLGSIAPAASATLQITAKVSSPISLLNFAEIAACDQPDVDSTPGNVAAGEDDMASITISAGLVFQTAAGPIGTATQGAGFTRQFAATGGVPMYSWTLTAAPDVPPLNFNPATGLLSGTIPSAAPAQIYSFTVRVTDAAGTFVDRSFSLLVDAPAAVAPIISTTPLPPAGVVGVPYSFTFTAHTGTPPYSFTINGGTLPVGLSLNSATGLLAGTPTTTAGSPFGFTVQVSSGGSTQQAFSIPITANPVRITTGPLSDGAIGVPYEQDLEVAGGLGPNFTWSVISGNLPNPLSLTGTGRVATILGTPGSNGFFSFTVRVLDNLGGAVATQSFTMAIAAGGIGFAPTTAPTSPTGTLGRPYSLTLTAIGGNLPYTWSLTGGVLPNGLILDPNSGIISGTPSNAGVFQITVHGASSNGQSGSQTISIEIAPPPLITSADPLAAAVSGSAYFNPLTASGGADPLRWTVTGTLPAGLSLNQYSGAISGVPTSAGTALNITVTDANGAVDTLPFTLPFLSAASSLTIVGSLPPAHPGVPYSATVQAIGGTAPYTFLLLGTCPGLTFDAAAHTLSGTPTGQPAGTVQVEVVDNVAGIALSNALVVTMPIDIVQTSLGGGPVGSPFNVTLTTNGAQSPVVWTLVNGSLPGSVSLDSSTGAISGTLTQVGTSTFTIQAEDAGGAVSQQQYTVTVGGSSSGGGGDSGGGGGGGGCGLLGVELLLVWMLRRRSRT